jgi:hypothetical protein
VLGRLMGNFVKMSLGGRPEKRRRAARAAVYPGGHHGKCCLGVGNVGCFFREGRLCTSQFSFNACSALGRVLSRPSVTTMCV